MSATGRPSSADGAAMAGLSRSANLNASRSKLRQSRTCRRKWDDNSQRNGMDAMMSPWSEMVGGWTLRSVRAQSSRVRMTSSQPPLNIAIFHVAKRMLDEVEGGG